MAVVIAIPFRGDGQWRDRAFKVVREQAESTGHAVVVGDSGDQPFSLARTWNAIAASVEWDFLVKWTADVLLRDTAQLEAAVKAAGKKGWARAFDRSFTFDQIEMRRFLANGAWARRPDAVLHEDGPQAVSREAWETVGGFDPHFVGYGFEDWAWFHGMKLHYGPAVQVAGDVAALWHPASRGKRRSESSPDPYWRRRAANYEYLKSVVYPIETREGWAEYVATR